jgi:AcrR family transcriptional regulator
MSKGDATRERILERAFRLASRDGLEGLSIGGLAGELGLSKSGLFAHFGSKEELQVEVLRAAAARFEAQVMRPAFRASRGEPRVRAWFENWLQWIQDASSPGGCLFLAASTELDDKEGRPRDFLVGMQRQLLAALARAASLAIEAGHFRGDLDCDQFAFELYGVMLGHHHFRRLLRDPRADARTRAAFDHLLEAARSRAPDA